MVIRGAAAFANPQEAHAQVQWNQRVWTGLCSSPTRPVYAPMDMNFGQPEQTEDPRARQRQDGEHSGHRGGDQADRGAEARAGRAGTGGNIGPLALIGLAVWAVGVWHGGW
eukprot:11154580-Alexandrium_andersonii.AAC.1